MIGTPPGSSLEEYCAQNPYTPICGYGGGSGGMLTCPYTGVSVSRAEDCPEFGGGGGGGGGGGCANSYSSDCGPDDDNADAAGGPTLEGASEKTQKASDCMSSTAVSKGKRDLVGTDLTGAEIEFFYDQEDQLDGLYAKTVRLMDHPNPDISAGRGPNEFAIAINRTFIQQDAEDRGVSYQHLLTDILSHEYTHVKKFLNDEDQPATHVYGDSVWQEGWRNFQDTFGTVAPTDRRYSAELHGPNWSGFPDCLR